MATEEISYFDKKNKNKRLNFFFIPLYLWFHVYTTSASLRGKGVKKKMIDALVEAIRTKHEMFSQTVIRIVEDMEQVSKSVGELLQVYKDRID